MLQIALTWQFLFWRSFLWGDTCITLRPKRKHLRTLFDRVDNGIYRICRIDRKGMNWKTYALNLLMANAVMVFAGYLVLRLQYVLFLNPNGIEAMEPTLSFNTIISFMTNTNLQHYSGESGLSYLSQMLVIFYDVHLRGFRICGLYGILQGTCGKE